METQTLTPTASSQDPAHGNHQHPFPVAEGFYLGASDCLSNWEQYSVGTFMLHHTVEQLCLGLIKIHLAYRPESYDLKNMLHLCTCFSNEPFQLFNETAEDRRLFTILIENYSAINNQVDFAVSETDAITLCDKVGDFTALAERLWEQRNKMFGSILV